MAEKKSWRDYSNYDSNGYSTKSSEEDEESKENEGTGSWRDYSQYDTGSLIGQQAIGLVNRWLNNHNSYISDYQNRFSGRTGTIDDAYVSDSADWLDAMTKRSSTLDAEATEIMAFLEENKYYLDQKAVQDIIKTINDAKGTHSQIVSGAQKDHEYWNIFGSDAELVGKYGSAQGVYEYYQRGEGYRKKYEGLSAEDLQWAAGFLDDGEEKEWLTSYASNAAYKEKSDYDIAAGMSEIAAMEQEVEYLSDYLADAHETLTAYYGAEYDQKASELFAQYGGSGMALLDYIEKKQKEIEDKKTYLQEAQEVQDYNREAEKWNVYTTDANFGAYAQQGAAIENPTYGDAQGWLQIGNWRAGAEDVGNIVTFSRDNYNYIVGNMENSSFEVGNILYAQMTEDEVKLHNAILAKDGKAVADQYLAFLKPQLESREAQRMAGLITSIDIPVLEDLAIMGYGFGAGVDQWASGVKQFFSDEQIDPSVTQQTNAYISNSLDGIGYYAHQAATTIGNMTPSILASKVLGFAGLSSGLAQGAGSVVMGVSAAGNAYSDALSKGYDKASARTYGTLVGAAEGTLQYLIGGIGELGGVSGKLAGKVAAIDNGLLRAAARLGVNIGGEIIEEEAQNYLEPLFRTILFGEEYDAPTIEELVETAIVTALSTGVLEGGGVIKEGLADKQTGKDYSDAESVKALIEQGLESDKFSESYKLAQEYKSKIDAGETLNGAEIRQLIDANDAAIAKENKEAKASTETIARNKLTELGETENVNQIAKLVAKQVSGAELTAKEKSTLVRSKYGSRVAKELRGEIQEEVGTKSFDIKDKTETTPYTPLVDRTEAKYILNKDGKATVNGEAIDLNKATVASVGKDGMTLRIDGEEVSVSDIEFEDSSQGFLYSAVSQIENITPGAATAIIQGYNPSSGLTVGEYLNGIDEAYTYGYHGYSVADLKAGQFTTKLTDKQVKDAYGMGKYVRGVRGATKAEAIKKMRTAVEARIETAKAEGKEAPSPKKLTITYNAGNGRVSNIGKFGKNLSKQQKSGIAVAKVLHNMGLGTQFEFFSSYVNSEGVRVFLNENGVEQEAYSGVYRMSDGTIRIDMNAYNGRGLTLDAMSHELTHFIQQWSTEKYEALADFLVKTYEKTDMTMNQRVLREQARLKGIRGKEVSYSEAYDEVVANAMGKMLSDPNVIEKLTELKAKDADLAHKLWEGFKKLLNKFFRVYESEQALFYDTHDLMEMKEEFEQIKQMWAEAFVEASENFQANLMTIEVGVEPVAVEDISQYSYSSLAEAAGFEAVENDDGTRAFTRDDKKVSKVTVEDIDNSPIGAFINFSLEMGDISDADATRQKQMFADICTMACKTNDFAMTMQFIGSAVFTGMKANADKQYGTTYDFPSICTKTQAVIDAMSAKMMKLGRGLKTDEIVQLYDDVFASGNPVPCPECYVFSRWIGIGGLLDNIKKYQDYYGNMAVKDVATAYLKMKAEVSKFADEQGISFGKAKGALTSKLTKEFNKLTEKIEKAQNQGEKVKPADQKRLAELEPMMNTVKSMTWLENVYFADGSLKKVNPNFRVPDSVLFDLNNGEAFATKYKEAWAFRTTQGAGYGKAITPYAEARLGEGVLVTNNTTNAIKGKAQGSLNNYFLSQNGKLDKQSRDALKRARLKQKIQAFIGGQRFQSTSDARYENASDYLLAALEMQAMGGMVQCYTKVDGAVPAFSAWGFSINQSLMPLNGGLDVDGNVMDTSVGGMKPEVAFENRNKHESAGTITIGVNDNHIRAMFKQLVRDFIIPYHASGGKADVVAEFRRIQEGNEAKGKAVLSTDYSRTQSDKVLSDDVLRWQGKTDAQIQRIHEIRDTRIAILTGGKVNMTVVRSNRFLSALYDKLNGGEWDGVKLAKSKVESQIFPNEFWDQTVSYEESGKITKDYLEYCEDLGFLHRFSGMAPSNGKLVPVNGYNENGERVQLTDLAYKYDADGNKTAEVEEFFWKVLTDRRMYDNNGKYLPQKVVTLNDTTADTVTGFAKKNHGREYDKAKAEALAQKIVKGEQYSSQETDVDTDQKTTYYKEKTQEVIGNERREETREAFLGRASKTLPEVDERGSLAFGFRRYSGQLSQNIREAEYRLKQLGIPVIVFEQLEGNKNGSTTIFRNDANAIPGVAVFIRHNATTDAAEIVGHEGYHYLYATDSRTAYADVLNANVNFASKAFIDYQQKYVGVNYFVDDVEIGSKEWSTLMEEIFAYITGDIHNGDPKGEVHKFLRDYDAVKAAWDDLIKKQATDSRYSSQENDLDSDGKQLTKEQVEFFAASVVRDADGRLLVMYHGTANGGAFTVFDGDKLGNSTLTSQIGQGFYFTNVKKEAESYMKNVDIYGRVSNGKNPNLHQVYLNITNPFDVNADTLDIDKVKLVYMDGTNDHFFDSFIAHYLKNKTVNGRVFTKAEVQGMSKADRVSLYVDYLAQIGTKALLSNMVKAFEFNAQSQLLASMKNRLGYDGIVEEFKPGQYQYVAFSSEQIKNVDNTAPTTDPDIRYSTHDTDNISNRDLLANAMEGIVNGSEEYKYVQRYKSYIAELNSLERKLGELNRQIYEIRFKKGNYDAEKLQKLETEKKTIADAISKYDKMLVSLEAAAPLRRVIENERKKASEKTKEHVKEIQQNKKLRAEQTELRHKIRKAIRDLDKILNRGNKKQNVKEELQPVVTKALQSAEILFTDNYNTYDMLRNGIGTELSDAEEALVKTCTDMLKDLDAMPTDGYDNLQAYQEAENRLKTKMSKLSEVFARERKRLNNTTVSSILGELADAYAKLADSDKSYVKGAYNEPVHNYLKYIQEEVGGTIIKDMTKSQLEAVYKAYQMVLHSVRTANQLFVNSKAESIDSIASQLALDFGSRRIPDKAVALVLQKLTNKLGWDYTKLYYALDRIGSDTFTELIMNIANSENIVMQDVIEAVEFRDEIVDKYGYNNWAINKKIDREFMDNTGKKFTMTLGQLMSLYAYSRRAGAWDHIEYGGFVFGEKALTNPRPADSYKLSKEQCEAITSLLTNEQKAYVEAMQKYLSEVMGAKGNEVSMQLYGINMFGEKNYFPIHVAGQYQANANESNAKAAEGFQSMSNAGFTHAQNPSAKAPFVLEGFNEIWSDHVNEMSRYHGTVPALEDLRRVMNRSSYTESTEASASINAIMENHFGEEAVKYFDNLYREANSGAIRDKLEKTPQKLLSLFRKNSVAYSLSVIIQQPAAMVRAYAMIDKKYFGYKGFGALTAGIGKAVSDKWTKAHTNAYSEMLKYAPGVTMAKEIGGFDTHTGSSIRSYLLDTNKSIKQKWKTGNAKEKGKIVLDIVDDNAIANLPNVADKIAWIEIWNACKRETVAKHKDLAPNSDEFMQIVGNRFTEVIRATQVYDSIFSKSPMLKSKSLAVQYLVSFMNEPNTVANMTEKAVRDFAKGDRKGALLTAAVVVHSIIFTNVLKSLIYAMRDDDEDETYTEKFIEAVVDNLMADINPLNYVPLARDVVSKFQGFDVERPDMAVITDAADAINALVKKANKDTENMTEEQIAELDNQITESYWKLAGSIASFFGIPLKNIYRDVVGIIDHHNIAYANAGKTTWLSAWDKIKETMLNVNPFEQEKFTKGDKLYDALVAGDQTYIYRLKNSYVDKHGNFDQSKYESAVVKALRENDPRIKAAAQAGIDGDSAERNRILQEIKKEGKFSSNLIIDAINAETNAIRNKDKPEKVQGQYGAYDFVEAVSAGDAETAQTVRDDIIKTYMDNGKTPAQAESAFKSDVKSNVEMAYSYGTITKATAEKMLVDYAGMDEDKAADQITVWEFQNANPDCDLSDSKVLGYLEYAESAGVALDMFEQFVKDVKDIEPIKDKWGDVEKTERDQILEVIDALPLTWQQKDAVYLAYGLAESKLWDVPW